ncbi:hypothetical protein QFZ96_001621 [Paraburkholderia youngii]
MSVADKRSCSGGQWRQTDLCHVKTGGQACEPRFALGSGKTLALHIAPERLANPPDRGGKRDVCSW